MLISFWGVLGKWADVCLEHIASQTPNLISSIKLGVDLRPEQDNDVAILRGKYPLITYKQYEDALASIRASKILPDVFLVMTLSDSHVRVIEDLLDALPATASVLILCEKPLDVSSKAVERLLNRDLNEKPGVVIRCIDHYLLKPGFRALKRLLRGELEQITPLREVRFRMDEAGLRGASIANLLTGGILLDHATHGWAMIKGLLDLDDFFIGKTLLARCSQAGQVPNHVETAAITPFKVQSTVWGDISGEVAVSKLTIDRKELLLIGDKATIRLNIQTGEIDRLTKEGELSQRIWVPNEAQASEKLDPYPFLISEILAKRAETSTLTLQEGGLIFRLCRVSKILSEWIAPYNNGDILTNH